MPRVPHRVRAISWHRLSDDARPAPLPVAGFELREMPPCTRNTRSHTHTERASERAGGGDVIKSTRVDAHIHDFTRCVKCVADDYLGDVASLALSATMRASTHSLAFSSAFFNFPIPRTTLLPSSTLRNRPHRTWSSASYSSSASLQTAAQRIIRVYYLSISVNGIRGRDTHTHTNTFNYNGHTLILLAGRPAWPPSTSSVKGRNSSHHHHHHHNKHRRHRQQTLGPRPPPEHTNTLTNTPTPASTRRRRRHAATSARPQRVTQRENWKY